MTPNPAENLVGQTINGRWQVVERKNVGGKDTTGGFFSVPYRVEDIHTGEVAFMKVINLSKALQIYQKQGVTTAQALNNVTDAHLFEVHLAEACKARKLKRIIKVIDHGDLAADIPLLGQVGIPYIVFEYADCDTHTLLDAGKGHDLEWHMATLHEVAVGLQELHGTSIAHQDLKRSNVVFLGPDRRRVKLIDLGRAVKRDRPSRNDHRAVPCQPVNSPPEFLYGYGPSDWDEKHVAADLYMLGSLTYSMIFDVSMTFALLSEITVNLRPASIVGPAGFSGSYADVLPALHSALAQILVKAEPFIDARIRKPYLDTLSLLCNPDPLKRGHPKDKIGFRNRYSCERFVSVFRHMQLLVRGVAAA